MHKRFIFAICDKSWLGKGDSCELPAPASSVCATSVLFALASSGRESRRTSVPLALACSSLIGVRVQTDERSACPGLIGHFHPTPSGGEDELNQFDFLNQFKYFGGYELFLLFQ
jgi:hypothetical protein